MKDHLQSFKRYRKVAITFESFDLDFYESFVDFLTFDSLQKRRKEKIRGLKVNTIGKTLNQLRIFLKDLFSDVKEQKMDILTKMLNCKRKNYINWNINIQDINSFNDGKCN